MFHSQVDSNLAPIPWTRTLRRHSSSKPISTQYCISISPEKKCSTGLKWVKVLKILKTTANLTFNKFHQLIFLFSCLLSDINYLVGGEPFLIFPNDCIWQSFHSFESARFQFPSVVPIDFIKLLRLPIFGILPFH